MYFKGSNDILVIWSIDIPWEDLWNSYLKKSFEIHGLGSLKSWMDLTQIQILMILSHPNKEFGFGPSNPNPWAQIHPIQTDHWCLGLMVRATIMSGRHRFKFYHNYYKFYSLDPRDVNKLNFIIFKIINYTVKLKNK